MKPDLLKDILARLAQRVDTPCDLDGLAKEIGYSKYYLCRAFHAATGEPLITYLRRLALARSAQQLRQGESILSVALDLGYQSQEAYHRAFSAMFGLTPRAYQKGLHHPSLLVKRPWDESLMPPPVLPSQTLSMPALRLYGIGDTFSYAEFDRIAELWETFHGRVPRSLASYGVTLSVEGDPNRFRYFAASQAPIESLPVQTLEVPAQTYQVFQHRGEAQQLLQSFNYIWGVWLPGQKRKVAGIDFERYPADYCPEDPQGKVDIYIPLV